MNVKHLVEERILIFEITEDLDHHSCTNLRRRIDYEIERFIPRKVIFDFNRVLFMDSAGIGFIIGRYKLVNSINGKFEIINIRDKLKRIFEMSGILNEVSINTSFNELQKKVI